MYIFAITSPESLRFVFFGSVSPGMLYGIGGAGERPRDLDAAVAGAELVGVSGASEAPKSTVRFVIAWMPPPEPMALYCTV